MADEEYLRARGWKPRRHGYWMRPTAQESDAHIKPFTIPEAVDLQVAEDRACAAFVLARSSVTLSTSEPSADPLNPFRSSVDIDVTSWHIEGK